ncbi:MAG: type I-E CRISPR-associated protein Cas7/Cse4/CasC [Oscillochloridaceae bacterium]|nr:type I-E CRISPR-associated protein Cas7/Cse4/CasC [Chloroflexaceae bacterium]MDW8389516.1 type I-E CRISPR-associated protein Cas7/Cse4/CasC [Oscillochloridaceae bacterium]
MLIAIHLLQNHAPSNLNRDDNNEPKDAIFGGVRRARISSQALKRSIRWSEHFRQPFEDRGLSHLLAMRTQLLPELVRERLADVELADAEKQAIIEAAERLGKGERAAGGANADETGAKDEKKGKRGRGKTTDSGGEEKVKTAQLMFLTTTDVDRLVERLSAIVRDKGAEALNNLKGDKLVAEIGEFEPHSVDIAMFGRMTTSSPFKDVEAAVQVAHAISTHAVEMEFDFYTAVDDISGEAGAGFIGDTAFNSATYYKYFSIDWEGLVKNLQGEAGIAATAVQALLKAAMFAIPSGKQNSFAAHNPPDLALVEVRTDKVPLSYANAFVKPVRTTPNLSLIEASARALQEYVAAINGMYGLQAQRAFLSSVPFELEGATRCNNLGELVNWLPLAAKE